MLGKMVGPYLEYLKINCGIAEKILGLESEGRVHYISQNNHSFLTFVAKLDIPKQNIQRNMDKRAMTDDRNMPLETLHQNSIIQVSIYEVDNQDCCKFCTNGIDRAMTIWDFKTLESSSQGLRIM
ncbi:hypothetical protein CapIbe_007278 [Capra ibex]